MKNIITIDFDIIMAPSIEIYNNLINEQITIGSLGQGNPLLLYCNADLDYYSRLSFYLYNLFSYIEKEKIHFVFDHHMVYKYLEPNEKYIIYNIDHHHDCGYPNANPNLYCGNWVLKMKENGYLEEYHWIGDCCSEDKIPNDVVGKIYDIQNFDLFSLPDPDLLVICASFEWVSDQYIPLFYMWLNMYNLYFNKDEPLDMESSIDKID